jgi:hypothetical protein
MGVLTEKVVKAFIESKLETERPKIMAHIEEFVKDGKMKQEIIDELGEKFTAEIDELKAENREIKERLESVKPESGWF